jgi:hypothetical protein
MERVGYYSSTAARRSQLAIQLNASRSETPRKRVSSPRRHPHTH